MVLDAARRQNGFGTQGLEGDEIRVVMDFDGTRRNRSERNRLWIASKAGWWPSAERLFRESAANDQGLPIE